MFQKFGQFIGNLNKGVEREKKKKKTERGKREKGEGKKGEKPRINSSPNKRRIGKCALIL